MVESIVTDDENHWQMMDTNDKQWKSVIFYCKDGGKLVTHGIN